MSALGEFSSGYLEEYSGNKLVNVSTAFLVLDVVFVALRFYCRYLAKRRLRWDDWLMIPALLSCLGMIALCYYVVAEAAVGRHVIYAIVHKEKFLNWYKACLLVAPIMYGIAAPLPKFAILALYLQVLQDKPSRYIAYATIIGLILNSAISVPLCVFRCTPISYGWEHVLNPLVTGGQCASIEPRLRWPGIGCVITDIVIMALPVPMIRRLTHSKSTQIGVGIIFALGSIGIVASCMRFAAFFRTNALSDPTWSSVELLAWTVAEPSICLIAACLLAFKPLLVKVVKNPIAAHLADKVSKLNGSRKQRPSQFSGPDNPTVKGWPHIPVSNVSEDSTICAGRDFEISGDLFAPPMAYSGETNVRKCSCFEKSLTTVEVRERWESHEQV